jgi:acyl dehydratase
MDLGVLAHGFYFEDVPLGATFRSNRRTITETDLVNFVNLTWFTEELFTNAADRDAMAIRERVVPGGLVYTFAEGLVAPSMQHTGLAFLNAELDVKGPTFVGDTIQVRATVIEARPTSKGDRGLVRTRNEVVRQNGDVVLVYNPLRLLMRRAESGSAG